MPLTIAEMEFMAKVPSRLKGIEEQLKRIADALEQRQSAQVNNPKN